MLTRDSKIPILRSLFQLVDPKTKRMRFNLDEAKRAINLNEPLVINDQPYYLSDSIKQYIGLTCFYSDEKTMNVLEHLYWEQNRHLYTEKPLTLQEFVMHPDYLGQIYGERMNKWWMGCLNVVYPRLWHKKYCEVIASLAIGTGKTTAAAISLSYEIYKLMLLKNPFDVYTKLVKGTKIVFGCFNVDKSLAYSVTFDPFRTIFAESPFFKDRVRIPGKSSLTEYGIYITDDIRMDLGSLDRNALGKAVFGAVLDEGNFNRIEDQTLNTYSTLRTRITSRFGTTYGFPGILWCVSSPITDSDSINTLIQGADPSMTYVLDNVAQWEVWPLPERYTLHKRFPVFIGDANNDPRILYTGAEGVKKYDANKILYVPENLFPLFKHDLYKNLRDLGGVRVAGASNLFRSIELIRSAFTAPTHLKNDSIIRLDFYNNKDQLRNYVNQDYFKHPLYPDCPRAIHLDQAEASGGDRFGIAATYCKYIQKVLEPEHKGIDIFDKNTPSIEMYDRFYYTDFCFAIEAKPNQKIPLRKVREFLIWLREIGYPIEIITGDQVSQSTRNDLELDGFKCDYLSVDKGNLGRDPWISFRSEVENSNIILPNYSLAIKECQHLIDNGEKVDHPEKFPDMTKGCFTGDTIIYYNDSLITMQDLAKLGENHIFSTYSRTEKGFQKVLAYNAHETKKVKKLIELEFEDGSIIRCTPDHLFMLENGTYKAAKDLTEDDELCHINQ